MSSENHFAINNSLKNLKKVPLSAVIITLNEESNIARCLSSLVSWVDEVLVFDSGSTDQTLDIAKKMGVKVIQSSWLGFGPTKKLATDNAQNNWILSVDADEEISLALQNEILNLFPVLQEQKIYSIPRQSFYLNQWIRYGGWYPDYQNRLFNKVYANWSEALIHEKVDFHYKVNSGIHFQKTELYVFLKSKINHYVFKNIEHQIQTNNRYSSLLAEQLKLKGKSFSWFHFFTKPSVKFIECYFLKLGFLDGYPGFVIAKNASYSVFLKWIKLKELKSKEMK